MPYLGKPPPITASVLEDADQDTKIQVEESADEDIIRFDTGGTERMTVASGGTVDVVGDLTTGTLTADGDTSAGDNATIGYTSAEGLILTGQGSTNDVTIKNDADADVITIATGGTTTTFAGDVTMIGTTPTLTIGDAGTEDTKIVFDGNAQDFHIGLDDTADDLVIGLGSALGTTTHMAFTEDGEVTKPLNPFFNAFNNTISNVTGHGVEYDVIYDQEQDDVGANYNASNGVFTAPVTGYYQFNTSNRLNGLTGNEIVLQQYWKTSNEGTKSYDEITHDAAVTNLYDSGGGVASFGSSAAFQMDASDTCAVTIYVFGAGSNVVDIQPYSYFSGYLIS